MRMRRRALFILPIAVLAGLGLAMSGGSNMPLNVTDAMVEQLRKLRAEPKFLDLPGAPAERERKRLEPLIDDLLDRLIGGIREHPNSAWVLDQMDPAVDAFHLEDTEAREACL